MHRNIGFAVLAAGAALLLGCAARNRATLTQPHAPLSQQRLELASEWAFTAPQDARRLLLLDFPLPGASDGPRDFRVFIAMPAGRDEAEISTRGGDQAQGFLIQGIGALRGKTEFAGGTVKIRRPTLSRGRTEVEIDATCRDGTRVQATARIVESESELRTFLRRHAADVAALDASATPGSATLADASAAQPAANSATSSRAAESHASDGGEADPSRPQPAETDRARSATADVAAPPAARSNKSDTLEPTRGDGSE